MELGTSHATVYKDSSDMFDLA